MIRHSAKSISSHRMDQDRYRIILSFSAGLFTLCYLLILINQDLEIDNIFNGFLLFFGAGATIYYARTMLDWIQAPIRMQVWVKRIGYLCLIYYGLRVLFICLGYTDLYYSWLPKGDLSGGSLLFFGPYQQVPELPHLLTMLFEVGFYISIVGYILWYRVKGKFNDNFIFLGCFLSLVTISYEVILFMVAPQYHYPVIHLSFFPELIRVTYLSQKNTINELYKIRSIKRQDLERAQQEAVGSLAAGVAHEINNPLSVIKGYVEHLEESIAMKKPFIEPERAIAKCYKSIDRISEITHKMANLTKSPETSRGPQPIKKMIEFAVSVFRQSNQPGCKTPIDIDLPESLSWLCEPHSIQIALFEILKNCGDALAEIDSPLVRISWSPHGEGALEISDNGRGFPGSDFYKLLDPFYSTKPVGTGLGMGLSIANRHICNNNGQMQLLREEQWTKVLIQLPG